MKLNFIQSILGRNELFTVKINDKILPIERGEAYEDPLDSYLKSNKLSEVIGGGTMLEENGEVEFCNLSFELPPKKINKENISKIINELERLGAPKGSSLRNESSGEEIPFGKLEGLGIYLDGVNLPDEVYQECHPSIIITEIKSLIKSKSTALREWTGSAETGLYFYGETYEQMKAAIQHFVDTYPLCKNARIVQIA